jgi:addiction module RelE/StbE family toxin
MAKQIVWSLRAQADRKEILNYWRQRNKSTVYVKKLNLLFKESITLLSKFPQIGNPTDVENVRIKVVKDYLIIYEVNESLLLILAIWDTRQDPQKLTKLIQ